MYRLGKYQLLARLGTGGMAEVWKARVADEKDAPWVVIKRVLPGHAHDQSFARSLRVEAQVLTHLRHPGIVQLLALEEIDGQMLLVLEHVDGCDLRALMAALPSHAPPAPAMGVYVAHQVALALAHAHGQTRSILHRDVSPSNVMVTRDGSVKLVDFGIAKALLDTGDEVTRSRSIKGKLAYMAPEQLAGATLGCPADVYGTGVLLHEMLTGRRLFTVTNPSAMAMVREARVPPPSSINPAVPAALDAICLRALALSPSDRFADGHELAAALAPLVAQLPYTRADLAVAVALAAAPDSTATGTVTVPNKPPARPRAIWPLIAAAVLTLITLTAWSLWRATRPATPITAAPPSAESGAGSAAKAANTGATAAAPAPSRPEGGSNSAAAPPRSENGAAKAANAPAAADSRSASGSANPPAAADSKSASGSAHPPAAADSIPASGSAHAPAAADSKSASGSAHPPAAADSRPASGSAHPPAAADSRSASGSAHPPAAADSRSASGSAHPPAAADSASGSAHAPAAADSRSEGGAGSAAKAANTRASSVAPAPSRSDGAKATNAVGPHKRPRTKAQSPRGHLEDSGIAPF